MMVMKEKNIDLKLLITYKNKIELQMMLDNPLEGWTYILDYKKILEFVFIEEKMTIFYKVWHNVDNSKNGSNIYHHV